MAGDAIGDQFQQRRALARAGPIHRLFGRFVHAQHVVAVDRDARNAVGRRAFGDRLGFITALTGVDGAVEVALDNINDGQVPDRPC